MIGNAECKNMSFIKGRYYLPKAAGKAGGQAWFGIRLLCRLGLPIGAVDSFVNLNLLNQTGKACRNP